MIELDPHEQEALAKVCRALSLAPGSFVVAGGWAARLLRSHPLAQPVDFEPLLTRDLDVAVSDASRERSTRVGDQLDREGFRREFRSDDRPPVTLYALDDFELEFIAPWKPRRSGNTSTVDVLGANAQTAKHVELLLVEPFEVELHGVGRLSVAGPASYLLQKTLSLWDRRSISKQGKDALYLWEIIRVFTRGVTLHADVIASSSRVRKSMSATQVKLAMQSLNRLAEPSEPVIREAAKQARLIGRAASPEAISLALKSGIRELLGSNSR